MKNPPHNETAFLWEEIQFTLLNHAKWILQAQEPYTFGNSLKLTFAPLYVRKFGLKTNNKPVLQTIWVKIGLHIIPDLSLVLMILKNNSQVRYFKWNLRIPWVSSTATLYIDILDQVYAVLQSPQGRCERPGGGGWQDIVWRAGVFRPAWLMGQR